MVRIPEGLVVNRQPLLARVRDNILNMDDIMASPGGRFDIEGLPPPVLLIVSVGAVHDCGVIGWKLSQAGRPRWGRR